MTMKSLGAVARFINGAAFKPTDWGDEGRPIIRIQNLTGTSDIFNFTKRIVKPELVVELGDLLVSWSATLDVYRWSGPTGLLNQHIFKVLPNEGIDPDYLFFALKGALAELNDKTHGSTMKHVVRGDFESTMIRVPNIKEQRQIADVLSRADGIVRLRREAQQKAAELVPSIFLEMFGDPAANPKGWPVVALGEALAAADYGSSTKASDTGDGVPLIRMGNVGFDGNLNLSNLKYVQLDDAAVEKYVLRKGDILFNRTNSKDLVGKTGLWDGGLHSVLASYFIRLRVDEGMLVPTYLWALMNGRHMKKVLFETARGAIGQANINSKELKAFRIALPPMPLQIAFENQVESVQSICAQQANASTKADAAFAALLSKAFLQ